MNYLNDKGPVVCGAHKSWRSFGVLGNLLTFWFGWGISWVARKAGGFDGGTFPGLARQGLATSAAIFFVEPSHRSNEVALLVRNSDAIAQIVGEAEPQTAVGWRRDTRNCALLIPASSIEEITIRVGIIESNLEYIKNYFKK